MKKKLLVCLFVFLISVLQVKAYDLDMSVDAEIKRKYDSSKLEQDVLNNTVNSSKKQSNKIQIYKPVQNAELNYDSDSVKVTKADNIYNKKLSAWTTFNAKSSQNITGYTKKGTKVIFTTTEPVYKKHLTIPVGTKFYGEIVNSHAPQMTGNGALVVIKLDTMNYNGQNYRINGKITKVQTKKVFFNNIKGKRQYITGIGKQINKGETFYKKTRQTSNKMSENPILTILSPIPSIVGWVGYAGTTVLSPLTALTTKGGNLSIPAGSVFEIKLADTVFVK